MKITQFVHPNINASLINRISNLYKTQPTFLVLQGRLLTALTYPMSANQEEEQEEAQAE